MDVIISWSGNQSRKVAEKLYEWLGEVLPGIRPWISTEDITKGSPWFSTLLGRLEAANFCIICITPENVLSPWLYFEAGAIAGKSGTVRVCPYLIGVEPKHLAGGPLSQFQATICEKPDTWSLVREINRHLQRGAHDEAVLKGNFDQRWPKLKRALDIVLSETKAGSIQEVAATGRLHTVYQLFPEAIRLLLAASETDGTIIAVRSFEGLHVQAGGKPFGDPADRKSMATWQAALRQLVQLGLLEDDGSGDVFAVTAEGYRVADESRAQGVSGHGKQKPTAD